MSQFFLFAIFGIITLSNIVQITYAIPLSLHVFHRGHKKINHCRNTAASKLGDAKSAPVDDCTFIIFVYLNELC